MGKSAKPESISLVSQENVDAGLHEDPKSSHYSLAFHACPTGGSVTCQEAATPTEGRLQPLPAKMGDVCNFLSVPLCLIT